MANVKITDLTELAAVDLATNDVLPIVDINNDSTKKVTIASLTGLSDANDYATYAFIDANLNTVSGNADAYYIQLDANVNVVQDNVAALETRRSDNVFFTLNLTGADHANVIINDANVEPTSNNTYSLGAPDKVWKELYLGPNSLKLGKITISDLGGEGITITGASGEQANVVTPQLGGAANVSANIATLEANVASTDIRLGANITLLTDADTAAETRLNANLDIVQDNVAAISVTLGIRGDGGTNDDVTVGTEELVFLGDTGITTTVSSNTVTIDLDDTAVSPGLYGGVSGGVTNVAAVTIDATGRITNAANISVVTNLDTLQDNINVLDGNADAIAADVTALEARRAANVTLSDAEDTAIQSRLTTNVTLFLNEDTALQSRLATNVTAFTNEDTALQARIAANTLVAAANDFVTFTRLQANIDLVQDNVSTASGGSDGVEARRVANIAGAISTVLTSDLTASRALSSDGSGKIAVATTTLAELNHVSGVTAAVQTQLDAIEARRAANNIATTFTDDVIVTGNLTVTGETVALNSTNKEINDTIVMLANGTTGTPSQDIGFLFNRGTQGNAAFFYDESATTFKLSDTLDPSSNTALSPVTASNLSVGIIDAATVKFDGTSVQDAISANVTTLTSEDTALQARLTTNVTAFTNEDTALQARITANATITTAIEARRVANIAGAISSVLTGDLTADRVMITNGSGKIAASSGVTPTELGYLDGLTLGTVAASKAVTADANGDVTFIREVDIDGNVVIGTNASNTVTIVGKLDLGAFS